jgi:serine/threonine-protein kinase
MSDQLDRLKTALAERYAILQRVGEGGMATVYLAEDVKHQRRVALKVLRPDLAAVIGHERFLREIRTTARLRHPHILPLYDSGSAEGLLYYVMPYVEGESLRERLSREQQLPVSETIRIASEVADALAYAHGQDVVHRDIKPENILLEAGHAVLADFGIARAIGAAGGEQLTETGLAIGTPTYMSPEQASGERVIDGRSDLYSLGCVVYEMLGGQPPFTGPTAESVIRQHLAAEPPSISNIRPAVPANVTNTIARALRKVPADRFGSAAELAEALAGTEAAPPVLAVRRRMWPIGLAAVAVVAVLALRLLWPGAAVAHRPMLAVLPFENLGTAADEYFADGITEEMTSRLAEISGLGVVSRTSAIRYKGSDKSLREIADELGVAYVLEGTVRTERGEDDTGRVRVTPQLIRVSDDTHLWTERYTASLTPGEIFSVQAEIAERVAGALNVTLLSPERRALRETLTLDREAYDAYLLGRFHWAKRTRDDLLRATAHFERAIQRDPGFAEAHVGLADTYALYPYYRVGGMSRDEAYRRAEAAARRATELDGNLAAAHASLGNILTYGAWRWDEADAQFRRAIELDPAYPVARYWYAELLMIAGRLDEALRQATRAVELDPASPVARHNLAAAYACSGHADEAIATERETVQLEPDFIYGRSMLGFFLALSGAYDEALPELLAAGWAPVLAEAFIAATRDTANRRQLLEAVGRFEREASAERGAFVSPAGMAILYHAAGARDSVFRRFEDAVERRSEIFLYNIRLPYFDSLRSDPRYIDLMQRIGLEP